MSTKKQRDGKLQQAKEILKVLGMPKTQYNDRSGWVLLALSNIKPENSWDKANSPLLATVNIMQFIREFYKKDYKPNSRETIRRQTLQQFEQARILDRNRDDPSRPTNSKDNNYSLNESILAVLREYPTSEWMKKVNEYKKNITDLKSLYAKSLNKEKIPITLPNGKEISLSPGKHNQLHADIVHEFCSRFIGKGGRLLYLGDTASSRDEGGKLMILEKKYLEAIGVFPMSHDKLPDVVVFDEIRNWLFLIEAVTSHGPVSPKRWVELEEEFSNSKVDRVYVSAFPDRAEFRRNAADIAWETEVWIADNPDHMVHFNGDNFLGPHKN
jgi:hypothetical protein